ncbi:MAG: type II toxin-antitoxin system VapB family antitoxin [Sphingopyxis sp.]|nr:type II toxin-antitoxin system VapB family antitoxin [Sphingopyxis sp.]
MGAQMNIKNAEAYEIASELAEKTGSSLTQVVLVALRAQKRELEKEETFERAMAIIQNMRSRMSPEFLARDFDDELYDEFGLPK